MKVVLLGAGASKGSVDSIWIPVAAEFGACLGQICPRWKVEFPTLLRIVEHLSLDTDSWGLEPVWSCMDYYAKLAEAVGTRAPWSGESRQLKKALLEVYGRRCDRAAGWVRDDSTIARLFRDEMQPGDVVVSFNWDTIAERVAARCGRRLRSGEPGSHDVRFAKPHGSTSWTLDLNTDPRQVTCSAPDGGPILDSLRAADVEGGREPLVLGAVPVKSELIREVQELFCSGEVFRVIASQWRICAEGIRDADAVVVVGYSFPAEDQYGRFLVQEGLRLRGRESAPGKGSLLRVEFFELEDRAAERARVIFDVFGQWIRELVYRGPVLPRDDP